MGCLGQRYLSSWAVAWPAAPVFALPAKIQLAGPTGSLAGAARGLAGARCDLWESSSGASIRARGALAHGAPPGTSRAAAPDGLGGFYGPGALANVSDS